MLTPTDIHYLVGLLSLASRPEDVDLQLGDFVYDEAARSRRDVDVTIAVRNADGSRSAYIGTEVKDHSRKLDSIIVEGLVQKLTDMPEITHRAIISASGFTAPAVNKARAHGVDLYELRTWNPEERFDFFQCEPSPAIHERYGWSGTPSAHINPGRNVAPEQQELTRDNPTVVFPDTPENNCPLDQFLRNTSLFAAKEAVATFEQLSQPGTQERTACVTVKFTDRPYIERDSTRLELDEVRFEGTLTRSVEEIATVAKALFRLGETQPISGCLISEFSDFGLVALMASPDRRLELGFVPISDRNREKIRQQQILRRRHDERARENDRSRQGSGQRHL